MFKKKPTVGLPEVSQLIDPAMSKGQGDRRKHWNITNFINIFTNIYTYIICDKNDSK